MLKYIVIAAIVAVSPLSVMSSLSYASTDRYPADFSEMDTNKDGVLTWDEFHAYYPELSKDAYDGADTQNDGRVTPEEWKAFVNKPR
ncbi:EF-hand domain-containing protein [Oceanidesulfovibrio marinus]|uniref:Calcium-binding protein n=1 Tax=Oceanidesulfovibrio marinus TaxID=370038 RepID=A0A6P1ZGA0_9BACT|nr:EF-hand domain-containing protein [Oceanidesulfovibrio marinus]QJT11246.1 calcium-binding protein [Oceanidesulfovibrio marinus]TVM33036.1 calcium-binding protein [Oceanidesulfovibrio marinus]